MSGARTIYAEAATARGFSERLMLSEAFSEQAPMTWAIYCYAEVALSHPLTDGNGRLARALLICALGRSKILQAPWLPITATFYRNAAAIVEALHVFNTDIEHVQSVFAQSLAQSLSLEGIDDEH